MKEKSVKIFYSPVFLLFFSFSLSYKKADFYFFLFIKKKFVGDFKKSFYYLVFERAEIHVCEFFMMQKIIFLNFKTEKDKNAGKSQSVFFCFRGRHFPTM